MVPIFSPLRRRTTVPSTRSLATSACFFVGLAIASVVGMATSLNCHKSTCGRNAGSRLGRGPHQPKNRWKSGVQELVRGVEGAEGQLFLGEGLDRAFEPV